jgi:hypothetical protein
VSVFVGLLALIVTSGRASSRATQGALAWIVSSSRATQGALAWIVSSSRASQGVLVLVFSCSRASVGVPRAPRPLKRGGTWFPGMPGDEDLTPMARRR